jgi:hypothetical protein
MLTLIATVALSLGGPQPISFQETTAAPVDDAAKAMQSATAALAVAKSYTFTMTTATERIVDGQEGGGVSRGAGAGDQGPTTGTYMQGLPMLLKLGESTVYKDGETLVHKNADGAWAILDPQARGGGRGGEAGGRGGERGGEGGRGGEAGGRGGERGGEGGRGGRGGEEAGGGQRGQRGQRGQGAAGARGVLSLMRVTAPHAMFAEFAGKTMSIESRARGEMTVLTGNLTEEAAAGLSGRDDRARGGAGGGEMETKGTYKLELKGGKIVSATLVVTRSGDMGERSFEMTTTSTFTFAGVGETELEVPAEVLAHFEI